MSLSSKVVHLDYKTRASTRSSNHQDPFLAITTTSNTSNNCRLIASVIGNVYTVGDGIK